MSAPLTRNAIIVNLASEGVPIAVIAQSLQVPSAHVFEVAREALEDGRLLAIPSYDWGKERGPAFKATCRHVHVRTPDDLRRGRRRPPTIP
jgi:hypothetical protein